MINGEKKLVEVFRAFFDKVLAPIVKTNDKVMADWRYLNSLISDQHIDYGKLDFYLVMLAPERISNRHMQNVHNQRKQSEIQRNNFTKKEFFEEQRSGVDYKFTKTTPDMNYLHAEVNNYRNSGLSPNKFPELNMSQNKDKDARQQQLEDASKRNLIAMLESFHNSLVGNQQKLENELKKDRKVINPGKQFSDDKKFH